MTYLAKHSIAPVPTDSPTGTNSSSAETSTSSLATSSQSPDPHHRHTAPILLPAAAASGGKETPPVDEEKAETESTPHVVRQPSRTITMDLGGAPRGWSPSTFLEKLPYPVSHFLGYRRVAPRPIHPIIALLWSFVGVISSILVISVATRHIPVFRNNGGPTIVASFGAAAVLEFHSITSPLAQPRNVLLSQIIAAITGVCISKLFALAPAHEEIRWVGGALACALATSFMALTNNVHPPAGATALIAVVDIPSSRLGWWLIPLVLLSCSIMMVIALSLNNIQRQFPLYWWSPDKPNAPEKGAKA